MNAPRLPMRWIVTVAALVALPLPIATAETYGSGVSLDQPTPIAELAADPTAFDGRTVRVEGTVDAVCERKGCWILLRDGGAEVRVQVPDDEIVFPADAVGERAAAEGTVEVVELGREEWIGWQRHLAEEIGETFDDTSVGEGPFRRVRIAGTGAEVPLDP